MGKNIKEHTASTSDHLHNGSMLQEVVAKVDKEQQLGGVIEWEGWVGNYVGTLSGKVG